MPRYIDADEFFRTFAELDTEPYNRFPSTDVILYPAKEVNKIVDRFCDNFCQYSRYYFGRFKDVDVAMEKLEKKCENCPLKEVQ